MQVLIVSTSDVNGGAAIAATRLKSALEANDIKANMIVIDKRERLNNVINVGNKWRSKWNFIWERLLIFIQNGLSRKNLFKVSIANTGYDITKLDAFKKADIINLNWINHGMLSLHNIYQILNSGKPIVWTMHDFWECTAICHLPYNCKSFKTECGYCPFIRFNKKKDLAYRVFKQKERIFFKNDFHVVTVSSWLGEQVKQSALLSDKSVTVIPNTLSLDKFKICDKDESRKNLSITQKYVIVFGAARIDHPIKGFGLLIKAIEELINTGKIQREDMHLLLFGSIKYPNLTLSDIPIVYTNMGWVRDTNVLSELYSASDVVVSSSLYETFGQTLIEAQACGCVPVSFGNSGQQDIIEHLSNGYLANYYSVKSLAAGIEWAFTEGQHLSKEKIRQTVLNKYSSNIVADQYIKLFYEVLKRKEKC